LDCLHILEHKLKQTLCVSELTSTYKPHLIAYVLLELEIDRISVDNLDLKKMCISIRLMHIKETNEEISECKRLIQLHLSSMESTNSLLDKFLRDNKMFDRTRSRAYRSSRALMLNEFSTELSDIEEEIEEVESENEKKNTIINNNSNHIAIRIGDQKKKCSNKFKQAEHED
jgi:hypothetical protein